MKKLYFDGEYAKDANTKIEYFNLIYGDEISVSALKPENKKYPYHEKVSENNIKYISAQE